MTGIKCKGDRINLQEIFGADKDGLKELFREVLQEVLEQEMTDAIGAEKGERSPGRLGYRSGYYGRSLVTRVGKRELRIPQDQQGQFSTQIFERYQRSEKALVSALAEMYIHGVSTRKVKAITEELCGHAFSASAISAVNKTMDESLERFAKRPLREAHPYLVLDARDEKVRQDGVIRSPAVQIAIGINDEGRRQILAVELANRESQTSWKDVPLALKSRGLRGVEFVVSDDHPGLKRAIAEVIPEAVWQRCWVHFLRNPRRSLPMARITQGMVAPAIKDRDFSWVSPGSGERFFLIIPGASLEVTLGRAEQLRLGVKQLHEQFPGKFLHPVTISAGVAVFPRNGRSADVMIRAADAALYQAKREGRDRVVAAAEENS